MPQEKRDQDPSPPEILYHYTTQEAFLSIVEKKELWATNARYVNDYSEMQEGADVAEDKLDDFFDWFSKQEEFADEWKRAEEAREELIRVVYDSVEVPVFLFSLSELGDLASQWRAYSGATGGLCLGFKTSLLRQEAQAQGFKLHPCVYGKDQQEKLIASAFRGDPVYTKKTQLKEYLEDLAKLLPRIKSSYFLEEREWRLISDSEVGSVATPRFRPGPATIVPFVPVSFENDLNTLAKVIVGPTPEEELAELAVESFLNSQSFAHCEVITSDVPLRF